MGTLGDFEWDDDKDAANFAKHGLHLPFAIPMFDDVRDRQERMSSKQVDGEVRFEVMAELLGRVIFCVFIWREHRRRLLSVRMAHRSERRDYEEAVRRG